MRNESGSALVMVMGVLAIVSLLGVGLLLQSRSDTKFTRAMSASQHTFGLADGGAAIAIEKIKQWTKQLENEKWTGDVTFKKLAEQPIKTITGDYAASGFFKAYDRTKTKGWDRGAFLEEYWLVQGRGDNASITTVIDAAIVKTNKASYGDY
jgi:hypothetical protein